MERPNKVEIASGWISMQEARKCVEQWYKYADHLEGKIERLEPVLSTLEDMIRYLDHNGKETDVSEFAREAIIKARIS